MTHEFDRVLARYNQRVRAEAVVQNDLPMANFRARRDEFLLPVGEEVGWFLRSLIIARGAKTIVELGTSYGYSTLFLADAARVTGGFLGWPSSPPRARTLPVGEFELTMPIQRLAAPW